MNDKTPIDPIALSIPNAAKFVGVGRSTIQNAINSGKLRSSKAGGRRLITKEALREWLKDHEEIIPLKPKG
jgi:excisionase family DNA binding protein